MLLPGFRTDVLGCIKGFDLFVMSSITEGLGTSLLDAMACSRAIVATEAGGIPEVVEPGVTGLLVPPRDPRRMARGDCRAAERRTAREQQMGRGRPRPRRASALPSNGWSPETAAVYARVAGRRP